MRRLARPPPKKCVFRFSASRPRTPGLAPAGKNPKYRAPLRGAFYVSLLLGLFGWTNAFAQDQNNYLQACPAPYGQGGRCRCTADLHEFQCRNGQFTHVPAPLPPLVTKLDLTSNNITVLDELSLGHLINLEELIMSDNRLELIHPKAFTKNGQMKRLILQNCGLGAVPAEALRPLAKLHTLQIGNNAIEYLDADSVKTLPTLRSLRVDGNRLRQVPTRALAALPRLEVLHLGNNQITSIGAKSFPAMTKLLVLLLKRNQIVEIEEEAFSNLGSLRILNLASNLIKSIEGTPFRGMYQMHDLLLAHNRIQHIPSDAFYNLSGLQVLDLENNQISFIHPDAFLPISKIEDLNLGNNLFAQLPPHGLDRLLHLKTFNNPNLREFPTPDLFPRIQSLVLSYAYHCCAFLPLTSSGVPPSTPTVAKDITFFPDIEDIDLNIWNNSVDFWPSQQNITKTFGSKFEEFWKTMKPDYTYPGSFPSYMEEYILDEDLPVRFLGDSPLLTSGGRGGGGGKIQCLPLPGPFLPCQDLFDWWTLRCGVWIVFLCALLGNGTVVFVLVFSRTKMDVPKFLVCNLAAADFFMGIYLGHMQNTDIKGPKLQRNRIQDVLALAYNDQLLTVKFPGLRCGHFL